jgi:hypothetical protein
VLKVLSEGVRLMAYRNAYSLYSSAGTLNER